MDLKDIIETDIWKLYSKSTNFLNLRGLYEETDRCCRFYIGDQWHGLKLSKSIEPITYNFIKQIVKQKVSVITENLFAINYSPENLENIEFMQKAKATCDLLNKKASKVWDLQQLDSKVKRWVKKAGIVGEAICYVDFDKDIVIENISNVDIMYGDENQPDIQSQPYILVRQRKPVSEIRKMAKELGKGEDQILSIIGDNNTSTIAGDDGKQELDDKTWLITKFWKDENGDVYYSRSTRYVDLDKKVKMGIKLYPFAHLNWEEQEGNARGMSEVKPLIPNQIETNRNATRRAVVTKNISFPHKVVNTDAIENPNDIDKVGATIKFKDMGSTRASDVFMMTTPAQMGSDAEKLQAELINLSKELSNAGDSTTGNIDPSSASGKAILAVQQAQQQPLNDQTMALKTFLEDIARLWFAFWKANAKDLKINYSEKDLITGEDIQIQEKVDKTVLKNLETSVKVDITPRGAYDKYAQELSLENLMTTGFITFEEYVDALDPDSVMPKVKLQNIINKRKEAQRQINAIDEEATMLQDFAMAQNNDANSNAMMQDYGQSLEQAQKTGYGADSNRANVANNTNLA